MTGAQPGSPRLGILREPAAGGWGAGDYRPGSASDTSRCCTKPTEAASLLSKTWKAVQLQRAARDEVSASGLPSLPILPFYEASWRRWNMHAGDACAFRQPRVHGVTQPRTEAMVKYAAKRNWAPGMVRVCCDCTHFW
mmetsp:Transcript_7990/g.20564  ORF Transcript_7990/g.20564 Transcript_7990/m.20564 type:complete len:138 (+) Transcript_7990:914-1327(+)